MISTLFDNTNDVAHVIQFALAPVFLLTGIAGLLNVMAGRLARVVDRGRKLLEAPPAAAHLTPEFISAELDILERRRHLASAAITACTLSALLVCAVVIGLFLEVLLQAPLKIFAGVLFAASTLALLVGLTFFLREVHLATKTVRIRPRLREGNAQADGHDARPEGVPAEHRSRT